MALHTGAPVCGICGECERPISRKRRLRKKLETLERPLRREEEVPADPDPPAQRSAEMAV